MQFDAAQTFGNMTVKSTFLRESMTVRPACCDHAMAYTSAMAGWRRGPNISESNVITRRYSSYTPQVRNFSLQYTSNIHPPLMSIQLADGRLEAVGRWTAVRLAIRRPLVNTRSVQRSEEGYSDLRTFFSNRVICEVHPTLEDGFQYHVSPLVSPHGTHS